MTKSIGNAIHAWGYFPKEKIENNKGKLLMLDIDFGTNCSLDCAHCFRKENKADSFGNGTLSFDEMIRVLNDGKELGLECVKFLGAGEPFENPRMLDFLEELQKMDIGASIFTKGHVLADDALAKRYFGRNGINSAKELCAKLRALDVSILLGFNSFNERMQNEMVGNVSWYTEKRNSALENLIEFGFNEKNPTRLALSFVPLIKGNYQEALHLYKFSRSINAYPVIAPPMIGGRCSNKDLLGNIDVSDEKKIELYYKIYKYNILAGLQTFEQIKEEGISNYAGGHVCNQIACGMYLTTNGTVLRCAGDDVTVFGNVREKSLKEIWENSENFKRQGIFNCGCPPKEGITLPKNLQNEVLKRLEKEF